ncbi:transcriptional activator [Vibrio phage vB_VpaS_AL-2]|nr:transcriptional activator [Vibrio phage vB_VpaS_AL-2]
MNKLALLALPLFASTGFGTEAEPEANTEAAGAATEGEATAKKEKVEKPKMPSQNGVTRPRPDTLCGRVWAIADEMSAKKQAPVAVADLLVVTDAEGLNAGNVRCEYAAWRKFHGVTGRIMSEKQMAEKAEKEAAKEAKKAEKEAAKKAREEERAAKKAEREAAKAEKEAEKKRKAEERAAAKAEKEAKAAEAKAAKEAEKKAKAEAAAAEKAAKAANAAKDAE